MRTLLAAALVTLASALPAAAARPWFGSIRGTSSGQPLDLSINRRSWELVGTANGQAVSLRTYAPETTSPNVDGTANGRCVRASMAYSPVKVSLFGDGQCPLDWTVDYQGKRANGFVYDKQTSLTLDLENGYGTANGSYGLQPVDLRLTTDGTLTGSINGGSINAHVENADMSDVLEHLYLFLKP